MNDIDRIIEEVLGHEATMLRVTDAITQMEYDKFVRVAKAAWSAGFAESTEENFDSLILDRESVATKARQALARELLEDLRLHKNDLEFEYPKLTQIMCKLREIAEEE